MKVDQRPLEQVAQTFIVHQSGVEENSPVYRAATAHTPTSVIGVQYIAMGRAIER